MAEQQLWLEDMVPGTVYPGATNPMNDRAFRAFAEITGDAHPLHYDPEYAATRTRFGKPLAHGLLIVGMSALGATPLSDRVTDSMVAMLEEGFRFLKPVFSGDTLTSEFTVDTVERKPGKAQGVVRFAVKLTNQRGETVIEGHHTYLMRCREAAR